jgi:hypothetical protein
LATSPAGGARRGPRFAAGRARALGLPTRGTTAPNRLRRVDRWIADELAGTLRAAEHPLVVDLGFGASPITTVELATRLRALRDDVSVVGLEIDPERVAAAAPASRPPALTFRRGGFELGGLAPTVVRAMNVLRQYEQSAVEPAWRQMSATGAVVVEGTCDELGRRACWFQLRGGHPVSLTLSTHVAVLERPSDLAERLPKALISRNVPGEPVHALFSDLDEAWASAAGAGVFGPRQRWIAAVGALKRDGRWQVLGRARRWRLGELTVAWPPD